MSALATMRHVRSTPLKMRMVANQVRGKSATFAVNYLTFCRRRAARSLLKLIKSAIANADQKGDMDLDNLVVAKLCVDQGPSLKRWMPRARGSATPILKRTCHVTVELKEK